MQLVKSFFFSVFLLSAINTTHACSMYKITVGQKTMVGTNEDAWRTASYIWFETGKEGEYGACYTGSRKIKDNKYAAQSGMNEHGLVYSRLASFHPLKAGWSVKSRKTIDRPDDFLKQILHQCKNVREVYAYLKQYDHSVFIQDVFIFIEASGKYLVVEPYSLQLGDDPNYVLSNFCPSITSESERRQLVRYQSGKDFLANRVDTSIHFCTNLSNAMHVCREKIGDGTLLTGIWDTKNKEVSLHFYHDYSKVISFNLEEELAKGNHMIDVTSLFPVNSEFEQLKTYVTPLNTPSLRVGLASFGALFLVSSLLFVIQAIRRRKKQHFLVTILVSVLCFVMFYYMYVLTTNMGAFYFSAPFVHFNSTLISASSYIPIVLLLILIPSVKLNYMVFKKRTWGVFWKLLLSLNNIAFITLFVAFNYWGFYSIF